MGGVAPHVYIYNTPLAMREVFKTACPVWGRLGVCAGHRFVDDIL